MGPRSKKQMTTTHHLSARSLATAAASLDQPAVREFKVRLPLSIAQRIEEKAKAENRPQNKVIVDELAAYPGLEQHQKFTQMVAVMENVLARYGRRILAADLRDDLLHAVDQVLAARTDGELQLNLDRLRVLRTEMPRLKRTAKE
jgi:hypothetical protein